MRKSRHVQVLSSAGANGKDIRAACLVFHLFKTLDLAGSTPSRPDQMNQLADSPRGGMENLDAREVEIRGS